MYSAIAHFARKVPPFFFAFHLFNGESFRFEGLRNHVFGLAWHYCTILDTLGFFYTMSISFQLHLYPSLIACAHPSHCVS
jgi:hypothetical protein